MSKHLPMQRINRYTTIRHLQLHLIGDLATPDADAYFFLLAAKILLCQVRAAFRIFV